MKISNEECRAIKQTINTAINLQREKELAARIENLSAEQVARAGSILKFIQGLNPREKVSISHALDYGVFSPETLAQFIIRGEYDNNDTEMLSSDDVVIAAMHSDTVRTIFDTLGYGDLYAEKFSCK